jgi:hypothetical protein
MSGANNLRGQIAACTITPVILRVAKDLTNTISAFASSLALLGMTANQG